MKPDGSAGHCNTESRQQREQRAERGEQRAAAERRREQQRAERRESRVSREQQRAAAAGRGQTAVEQTPRLGTMSSGEMIRYIPSDTYVRHTQRHIAISSQSCHKQSSFFKNLLIFKTNNHHPSIENPHFFNRRMAAFLCKTDLSDELESL